MGFQMALRQHYIYLSSVMCISTLLRFQTFIALGLPDRSNRAILITQTNSEKEESTVGRERGIAAIPTRSPRWTEIPDGVGPVANGQVDGVDTRHKRGGGTSGTIISVVLGYFTTISMTLELVRLTVNLNARLREFLVTQYKSRVHTT